jgi:hypothetical protein
VGMLHSILQANDLVTEFWRWYLRQSLAALEGLQQSGMPFASPPDWMSSFFPELVPTIRGSAEESEAMARRIAELEEQIERIEARVGHDSPRPGGVSENYTPQG